MTKRNKPPISDNPVDVLASEPSPMDKSKNNGDNLENDTSKEHLLKIYQDYKDKMRQEVDSLSENLTINSIESMLSDVKNKVSNILDKVMHEELSKIDEGKLIAKKKRNLKSKA